MQKICGKSKLYDLYIKYLKEEGIDDNHIININLELLDYDFESYKVYIGKIGENEVDFVV